MPPDAADSPGATGTSGEGNPRTVDRRRVLRGGLGTLLAGSLAGCQSLPGGSDGSAGSSPDGRTAAPAFEDDWADGTLDGWTAYVAEGDADARVERLATPAGNAQVLSLSQSTGGGRALLFGTETAFLGWDDAWTVRTAVHTTALDPRLAFQAYHLLPAFDPDNKKAPLFRCKLGVRNGDGQLVPAGFAGHGVESVRTDDVAWEQGRWYEVELSYDGRERYTARVWPSSSQRPTVATVEASGPPRPADARPFALLINGQDDAPFRVSHSFVRLSGGLSAVE